jgi:hypothetical protein
MFAWVDSMGKEVTVREIVEHYYKDEKFGNSEQLAQQTAVEWLYNDLFPKKLDGFSDEEWSKIIEAFEQAKEMDKRQKKRAWDRGKYIGQSFPKGQIEPEYEQDAEEYYTQTYGK